MKVTAIKPGYFGKLRQIGDEFDVPDGTKASWFAPAAAADQKPSEPAKKQKPAAADLV